MAGEGSSMPRIASEPHLGICRGPDLGRNLEPFEDASRSVLLASRHPILAKTYTV